MWYQNVTKIIQCKSPLKQSQNRRQTLLPHFSMFCCGRQEAPAVLISRLLLRMHRMYVASFVWTSTKNEWNAPNANEITRVWTSYLS